jgi:hypothetical protein
MAPPEMLSSGNGFGVTLQLGCCGCRCWGDLRRAGMGARSPPPRAVGLGHCWDGWRSIGGRTNAASWPRPCGRTSWKSLRVPQPASAIGSQARAATASGEGAASSPGRSRAPRSRSTRAQREAGVSADAPKFADREASRAWRATAVRLLLLARGRSRAVFADRRLADREYEVPSAAPTTTGFGAAARRSTARRVSKRVGLSRRIDKVNEER